MITNATAKFVKADCRGMFSDNATSEWSTYFIIVLHATSTFFATFSTSRSIARKYSCFYKGCPKNKSEKRARQSRKVVWEIPDKFQYKLRIHIAHHLKSLLYGRGIIDSELVLKFIGYFPDYLRALSRTLWRFFGQPLSKQLYVDTVKNDIAEEEIQFLVSSKPPVFTYAHRYL